MVDIDGESHVSLWYRYYSCIRRTIFPDNSTQTSDVLIIHDNYLINIFPFICVTIFGTGSLKSKYQ